MTRAQLSECYWAKTSSTNLLACSKRWNREFKSTTRITCHSRNNTTSLCRIRHKILCKTSKTASVCPWIALTFTTAWKARTRDLSRLHLVTTTRQQFLCRTSRESVHRLWVCSSKASASPAQMTNGPRRESITSRLRTAITFKPEDPATLNLTYNHLMQLRPSKICKLL